MGLPKSMKITYKMYAWGRRTLQNVCLREENLIFFNTLITLFKNNKLQVIIKYHYCLWTLVARLKSVRYFCYKIKSKSGIYVWKVEFRVRVLMVRIDQYLTTNSLKRGGGAVKGERYIHGFEEKVCQWLATGLWFSQGTLV